MSARAADETLPWSRLEWSDLEELHDWIGRLL